MQTWRLDRAEKRVEAVQAEFDKFKGGVAALGEKAKEEALRKELEDKQRKEKADEENRSTVATLNARVSQLRRERDAARSSIVPPSPSGSKCPEGQACFDRAELERTLREHRQAVRGLVDEGSQVEIDLGTARKWAADTMTERQAR